MGKTPAALGVTLLIVLLGWVMFRAADPAQAGGIYAGMLGLNGWVTPPSLALQITRESLIFLTLAITFAAYEPRLNRFAAAYLAPHEAALGWVNTVVPAALMSLLATMTLMKMAEQSFSPFLYFQF
jgi:alginate O-acetyltransferase complex protein AlgI